MFSFNFENVWIISFRVYGLRHVMCIFLNSYYFFCFVLDFSCECSFLFLSKLLDIMINPKIKLFISLNFIFSLAIHYLTTAALNLDALVVTMLLQLFFHLHIHIHIESPSINLFEINHMKKEKKNWLIFLLSIQYTQNDSTRLL